MPGPFFRSSSWTPFTYQGTVYTLTHLDEYEFSIVDTDGITRAIVVTFSDHCFTRKPEIGDDSDLLYPSSDRNPGHFCFKRYQLSFKLVAKIADAAQGKVWRVQGENFATLPVQQWDGSSVMYGIIFSLDRVTGLSVQLHMRVKTAYPVDEKDPAPETFGETRFKHLVALRMKNKMPNRITGGGRKPGRR
jgi:hypothetical protein